MLELYCVTKFDSDENSEIVFKGTRGDCIDYTNENDEKVESEGFYLMIKLYQHLK